MREDLFQVSAIEGLAAFAADDEVVSFIVRLAAYPLARRHGCHAASAFALASASAASTRWMLTSR